MSLFRYMPSRAAQVITGRNLRPGAILLVCAASASFGFTAGTLKAKEVSNQPGLRDPCRFGRRPERISTRQFAFADRLL